MSNLSQLLESGTRPQVVEDLTNFAEKSIAEQSGIAGMALKGAVATAKKVKSDVVAKAVNALLPDVLNEMEPHWQVFDSSRSDDFGAFLSTRSKDVTDSILNVADRKADEVNNNTLTKTYKSLRSKAAKILEPKVPELANILQRHM